MQCEVCGRLIVGKPHRVIIEGAKMTTCSQCAKLGSGYWELETKSFRQPTRRKSRTGIRRVPMRQKVSVNLPENLEVVEGFRLRIRRAREKLGLSQEDLGRKIKEKISVIKKVESGKMVPDHRLAGKLEHELRIKLLVPLVEPEISLPSSLPSRGVTLGEIVHLKNGRRRRAKNEGDHS